MITILQVDSPYMAVGIRFASESLVGRLLQLGVYRTVAYVDNECLDTTLQMCSNDSNWITKPKVISHVAARIARPVRDGDLLVIDNVIHMVSKQKVRKLK